MLSRHLRSRTAFTLLEIALVIVIVILLITAAIPMWKTAKAVKRYSPGPPAATPTPDPTLLPLPPSSSQLPAAAVAPVTPSESATETAPTPRTEDTEK